MRPLPISADAPSLSDTIFDLSRAERAEGRDRGGDHDPLLRVLPTPPAPREIGTRAHPPSAPTRQAFPTRSLTRLAPSAPRAETAEEVTIHTLRVLRTPRAPRETGHAATPHQRRRAKPFRHDLRFVSRRARRRPRPRRRSRSTAPRSPHSARPP